MPPARGENSVTSVPRSRWNFSCGCTLSRSWSSLIFRSAAEGFFDGSFNAAICAARNTFSASGSVV